MAEVESLSSSTPKKVLTLKGCMVKDTDEKLKKRQRKDNPQHESKNGDY